jgi:hypothetical protein
MFYQNQDKIDIGLPLVKQILNCSKNIDNFYSKDWNSTYSSILPHAYSISRINKKEKSPIYFLRKRKKSTKEEPYLDLGLEWKKMEFYRIMIFFQF